jgi:hypothetical protein
MALRRNLPSGAGDLSLPGGARLKKRDVTNLPASVHDRLLKIAKERGVEFQDMLINYALERWLYRMTQSMHRDRFVLKGAMLFAI